MPVHRVGDVGLFLVWAIFAAGAAITAIGAAQDSDFFAAAYRLVVAAVLLINAVLFLLRGPAVRRGAGIAPLVIALVGTWVIIPLSWLPITWRSDWLLAVSTVGLAVAYGFVIWALVTLRRSFSIFPEARALVRHGPYSLVRHPLYAAYFVTYLLIALPRISPAALGLAIAGITAEVLRARNEEHVLAATFADYDDYAASTPRFLPRIDR
jgi:protein-S-isoprenylcysteine O-methyltransferase Ste14